MKIFDLKPGASNAQLFFEQPRFSILQLYLNFRVVRPEPAQHLDEEFRHDGAHHGKIQLFRHLRHIYSLASRFAANAVRQTSSR
jgi:hypothetical protein